MPVKLFQLLKIQSFRDKFDEMHSYILKCIKEIPDLNYHQDRLGNIYVTKGKSGTYPAFICHTDTKSDIRPNFDVLRMPRNFWMGYQLKDDDELHHVEIGVDKAGIYACLKLLEELPAVKVVFYVNGATSQQGAKNSSVEFFDDCRWVAQCDRRGNTDLVFKARGTSLASDEFIEAATDIGKKFKFVPEFGMTTDVVALKEDLQLPLSAVNISAGFWAVGDATEHIVEGHLCNTIFLCKELAKKLDKVFPHKRDFPIINAQTSMPCRRAGCHNKLLIVSDVICSTCTTVLKGKGIKCKHCSGAVFTGAQYFYEICYNCNRTHKHY
jgi:tripeptide aminopeptidase